MLVNNPYVIVIALDFSKAFDTIRQVTLAEKLVQLEIPDHVYNWLCNFLIGRTHCTEFNGDISTPLEITASIVQGSAVGPTVCVVIAADPHTVTPGNEMCKYADDTHLIIPASNFSSRAVELDNVDTWSRSNNLKLNRKKSSEIIFYDCRRHCCRLQPSEMPEIARVSQLDVLRVTITNRLVNVCTHATGSDIVCAVNVCIQDSASPRNACCRVAEDLPICHRG